MARAKKTTNPLTRYLLKKWAELVGIREMVILNHLNVRSSGIAVTQQSKAYTTNLNTRAPHDEGLWTYKWEWIGAAPRGVSISHTESSFTAITVEADAPVGSGKLRVTGTCNGVEYPSEPYFVRVLAPVFDLSEV